MSTGDSTSIIFQIVRYAGDHEDGTPCYVLVDRLDFRSRSSALREVHHVWDRGRGVIPRTADARDLIRELLAEDPVEVAETPTMVAA